jgi:5'-nucleotidase
LIRLGDALKAAGFRVVIAGPDRERSAVSHGITLWDPLRIEEYEDDCYAISGTPVDCVYVALLHLLKEPSFKKGVDL